MADSDLRGRKLGEFLLQEELDRGAYGVVYRAEQPALGRDVVVKVLQRDVRDQDAMRRFLREAQVASVLDHPYAAHVYAFGVDDVTAKPWIAMELVKGVTLARWSKAHGPMPLDQLVPFFKRVAEVVQAAHEQGIVHRDLKPSNIMVLERGERLIPKLLDFGVAKWTEAGVAKRNAEIEAARADAGVGDSGGDPVTARVGTQGTQSNPQRRMISLRQLTRDGAGLGSLPYMSPEQYRDSSTAGAASDIYALGVIVYELLTGRRPFVADTAEEYQRMHLEAVPPRLDGFSPRVTEIVQHALSKDPETRPRSALDMARQLREALQAEPREQLRSLATVWNARQQPRSLLLRDDALHRMETEAQTDTVGELERSFMAESRRDTLHRAKRRRAFVISAAIAPLALLITVVWADLAHKAELANETARHARQVAEVTIMQAELEQGRSALLYGEPDAASHLAKSYRRDHAPMTAFMLARALQPHLDEQARFTSSFGRMWSATFSPDGQQVVTTDDKNAQIWDARSLHLAFTLAHGDTVYHAVYSADGARIFTACGDGAVRIWDAHAGALVRELRHEGRALRYRTLSTSLDGKLVAAIDMAGAVAHVWDVQTGAALAELRNEGAAFPSLAFSADGKWIATSGGKDARVFDVHGWSQVAAIPRVRCMSWNPAGTKILTGDVRGGVSLWDIPSGREVHRLRDLGEAITAVAYAPDGRTVVAASRDGAEYVWDATSGELRNQGNYLHEAIRSVEFDPSSTFTVAAALNGFVAVVDAKQGMPVTVLSGPRNTVVAAHFDPEARRVIAASWDRTVRIWSAEAPYRQWGAQPVADSCGVVTALEPDRRIVAIGCDERPTQIWDTIRGEMLAALPSIVPSGDGFSSALPAVSAAGDRAAIARGSTVELYALPGGALLRKVTHSAAVNTVAFAAQGLDLVTGTVDGSLLVTRDSGAQLVLPKAPAGIDAAGFLPDGRVVAADALRHLRVYDMRGTVTATLEVAARVFALRMSPDGRRVITLPRNFANATLPELWDVDHGRLIARMDEDGQGHVWAARFVGGYVITASSDGAARRWDAATGQLQQRYRGGTRFLAEATLSPDGSMIVGGDANGLLRFWDVQSGLPLWTMPAHRSPLIGIYMEGDDIVTRGYSGDISRWRLPKSGRVIEACDHNERCATVLP